MKYSPGDSGKSQFNATNLQIFGSFGYWSAGQVDTGNLLGTARTLDGDDGSLNLDCRKNPRAEDLHCTYGIVSRNGWTLRDDSKSRLLDTDPKIQWVIPRSSNDVSDWYFFGYGHDYRTAIYDFTRVAGKVPVPPRYAFGVFFSRWWAYNSL